MAWELREIRLVGFKSFPRRTRIALSNGLTAIVGSNGCGKTNIADSVRYALGEMRPQLLRIGNLEDIIFAGTASASPVLVAEVTLSFENNQDHSEFTIIRRLTRGGDSEYRIDGQSSRLKDVQRKLESIGIVSHRGVVVELRQMDEVLLEGSKLPRQMIEEGCGIAPFLERRNQAQVKLTEAIRSLDLLEPRILQIQSELDRLSQQAQRAKRWRTTREALDRARNNEQWGEVRRLRKEIDELAVQLEKLRTEDVEERQLTALQTAITEAEAKQKSVQEQWDKIIEELFAIGSHRESASLRLKEIELNQVRYETLLSSAQEELTRIDRERDESSSEQPTTLYQDLETINSECTRLQGELARLEEVQAVLNQQQEEYRREYMQYELQQKTLTTKIDELKANHQRLTQQLQELAPIPIPDSKIGEEWKRQINSLEIEIQKFKALSEQQSAEVNSWETKARMLENELTNIRAEHGRLERETEWIERMLVERPDLTSELRELIAKHSGDVHLLRDEANEHALLLYSVAASDRIHLPDKRLKDVLQIAIAKKLRCEWTTGTVTEIVELSKLLSENPPVGVEWLAVEGITRDASGIIRTAGDEKTELPVGLPKQISVLRSKLKALIHNEHETEKAVADAKNKLKTAREHLELSNNQISKANQNRIDFEQKLIEFQTLVVETKSRNELRVSERDRIQYSLAQTESETTLSKQNLTALVVPALPDITDAITSNTKNLAQGKLASETAEQHRQRIRIELRNYEIQKDQRKQKLIQLNQRHTDTTGKIEEYRRELSGLSKKIDTTRNELHSYEQHEIAVRNRRNELDPIRIEAQDALLKLRDQQELIRNRVEQWRMQLALLEEKSLQTKTTLSEKERFAAETGPEPKETVRVGTDEILRLEQRLRSFEPVNHLAEQEFDSLKQESDFLHKERDQIREAAEIHRKSVDEAIRFAIERLTTARVQIERNFTDIIARLFPGGEAALEWGEGDILDDAPLLLKVSPRGKRIRSLRVLSGGERALVALAFLVAVLSQNRTLPFLILDEVDAPLDEENTVRFLHWVKDLTATTQVVILTHNRQSIAASDSWVGVMMPEPGISQVVKVIPALEES